MAANTELDKHAQSLLATAETVLRKHYIRGKHHVACAALSASGAIYKGLHLDSSGIDICAEPIAIAESIFADDSELRLIVAVAKTQAGMTVINPCGNCLQLLSEMMPGIEVVANIDGGLQRVAVSRLLPYPYRLS